MTTPITVEMTVEPWISATKIAVPQSEEAKRGLIREINKHVYDPDFPVMLAPYYFSEFLDQDEIHEGASRIDAFDDCLFAESISDLWITMNVLSRNGMNDLVRSLTAVLDDYILGIDCVDVMDTLDL